MPLEPLEPQAVAPSVPFETLGHEDSRDDAGRRAIEAHRQVQARRERYRQAPAPAMPPRS